MKIPCLPPALAAALLFLSIHAAGAAPASGWVQAVQRMGEDRSFAPLLERLYGDREIRLSHQGRMQAFTLSTDEFALRFSSTPSWAQAESLLPLCPPGTQVAAIQNPYVVYQIPRRLEARDLAEIARRWNTSVTPMLRQAALVRGISPVLLQSGGSRAKNADGTEAPAGPHHEPGFRR